MKKTRKKDEKGGDSFDPRMVSLTVSCLPTYDGIGLGKQGAEHEKRATAAAAAAEARCPLNCLREMDVL